MYSKEYLDRLNRLRNAMHFDHCDQVPIMSTATGWMVCDSPYSLREAYYDFKIMEKVNREYIQRYNFDGFMSNGAVYAFPFLDALGGGSYKLNYETEAMSVEDKTYIFPEDYPEITAHPERLTRIVFERKFPDMTTEKFADAMGQFMKFAGWAGKADKVYKSDYSRPLLYGVDSSFLVPLEMLNAGMRGLGDLCVDFRRSKEALKDFCDAYWEKITMPGLLPSIEKPNGDDNVCEIGTSMLAHAFMNPKQFGEFYWPYMEKAISLMNEHEKSFFVFCESSMLRFKDYFMDLPKRKTVLHIESDNIFDVRAALPEICLAGGFSTVMLANGSEDECKELAKSLIDGMGEGYIVSTDKIPAYKNDAKRENLLALIKYVQEYTV